MSDYQLFKQQVLDTCQALARQGYLIGTGGNVSIRIEGEDALAITPSSRDYLTLTLDDMERLDCTLRQIDDVETS